MKLGESHRMLKLRLLSLTVLGAGLGVGIAHANPIILNSFGSWSLTAGGEPIVQSETLSYPPSNTGSFPALATLSSVDTFAPVAFISGVATYSDGTGDALTLNWTFADTRVVGNVLSADGTWLYAGGAGKYAPSLIVSGAGTFSISMTNVTNGDSSGYSGTDLVGDLSPAPEPASMTLLGLGIVGLAARRRHRK